MNGLVGLALKRRFVKRLKLGLAWTSLHHVPMAIVLFAPHPTVHSLQSLALFHS